MKIIITERQQILLEMSPFIRRRIVKGERFIENLGPQDVCKNWKPDELEDYVWDILSRATIMVVSRTEYWEDDDEWGPDYDMVHEYFSKKYLNYLIDFYNNNCKK